MSSSTTTGDARASAEAPPASEFREPPREAWYCARSAGSLALGAMASVTVLGDQIVIGRTKAGRLFALRDRCPHRGAPLSEGQFDGTAITCPFHGWRFGADGRCQAMPTLVDGDVTDPGQVKVGEFPVRESDGIIWLYLGAGLAEAPPVPALTLAGATRCRVAVSVLVEASYDLCVLSLIDPGHVGYVHNSWWWRPTATAREKVKDFEPLPFGFRMKAHKAAANSRGYRLLGRPQTEVDFLLPGQRIERIRMGERSIVNATFATPIDARRTLLTNVLLSDLPQLMPLAPLIGWAGRAFLRQDQRILELAQQGLERKPTMLLLGQADRLGQWYFRLKRDYAAARHEGKAFSNTLAPERLRWRT
ncbi:aromatic ring-hydroxylating dioxygenase subunit alpha [Bosea sp. LjRoot90]|uniref:Rieske 2Fe-2S domain-containing protein n=1 Tax=Bosea sp. LjRoot90 TaxID=3342342 RepID=UPI003ED127B9